MNSSNAAFCKDDMHIYIYIIIFVSFLSILYQTPNSELQILRSYIRQEKKITRSYVMRVVMGPADTFTPAKMRDEVNGDDEVFVWGVLVEQHNVLDVGQFAIDMSLLPPGSDKELLIGRVSPDFPTNLTKPEQWTVKNFLNFGDVEAWLFGAIVLTTPMTYGHSILL